MQTIETNGNGHSQRLGVNETDRDFSENGHEAPEEKDPFIKTVKLRLQGEELATFQAYARIYRMSEKQFARAIAKFFFENVKTGLPKISGL